MAGEPTYFEQAADVLKRALAATNSGEQGLLLDEALHLNRLAVAEERARLAAWSGVAPADPKDGNTGS